MPASFPDKGWTRVASGMRRYAAQFSRSAVGCGCRSIFNLGVEPSAATVETAPTRITVGLIGEGASFAAPPSACTLRPGLRRHHPLEPVSCEKWPLSAHIRHEVLIGWRARSTNLSVLGNEQILAEVNARVAASGVKVDTLRFKNLWLRVSDLVIEQAKACDADPIVIGTRGRPAMGRFLPGSDAEQTVGMALVPMLLARATEC